MADKQVVTTDDRFPGAVHLEYYLWNNVHKHHLIIETNNFLFNEDIFILEKLEIKDLYGVILNEMPNIIYTGTITRSSRDVFVPVTVRALRIIELTKQQEQQAKAFQDYRNNRKAQYINYDALYIDRLLDISKLPRTGYFVTVPFNKEKNPKRELTPGFYKRYEIDVFEIDIHNGIIVTLINNDEKLQHFHGVRNTLLPIDWFFMIIQDAHYEQNMNKIEVFVDVPVIRFHTYDKIFDYKEHFETTILLNVLAIELINARVSIVNSVGETKTFYNTVYLLAAYMNNRDIRLDQSTWAKSGYSPISNAFNIEKEVQQRQNLLTMSNNDVEYSNVFEEILRIPQLNVSYEYSVIIKIGDKEHYLRPGFYDNKKAMYVSSILINTDVRVTVINDKLEYKGYLKDSNYQELPTNCKYLVIQISHYIPSQMNIFYENTDVSIIIYTNNRKYKHTDWFEVDILDKVKSIQLINAYIGFVYGTNRIQFFNTVYFLPAYTDNLKMNLIDSYWIDARNNARHQFKVKQRAQEEQLVRDIQKETQVTQVPVSYSKPEVVESAIAQFTYIAKTEKQKSEESALAESTHTPYPMQNTQNVAVTHTSIQVQTQRFSDLQLIDSSIHLTDKIIEQSQLLLPTSYSMQFDEVSPQPTSYSIQLEESPETTYSTQYDEWSDALSAEFSIAYDAVTDNALEQATLMALLPLSVQEAPPLITSTAPLYAGAIDPRKMTTVNDEKTLEMLHIDSNEQALTLGQNTASNIIKPSYSTIVYIDTKARTKKFTPASNRSETVRPTRAPRVKKQEIVVLAPEPEPTPIPVPVPLQIPEPTPTPEPVPQQIPVPTPEPIPNKELYYYYIGIPCVLIFIAFVVFFWYFINGTDN